MEYDDELKTLHNDLETVTNENKVIKKIISEQQKFLETVRRDKIKNNIFISGIPNRVNIGGVQTEDNETIISHILLHLVPTITADDYSIIMAFEHREGFTRHSAIVSFTDCKTKEKLLGTCKNLKNLNENNWLKRVYLKSEQPQLTSKENMASVKSYGIHIKMTRIWKLN